MCIMCRVPVECVIYCDEDRPRLQASDWPELITWPQYWLLIGQFDATKAPHWLIVSRDELMTLISPPASYFQLAKSGPGLANQRAPLPAPDQSEARVWLAGLVCRTFPCRFVTLGLTPGWPKHNKTQMRKRTHFNGFLGPFRPKLNLWFSRMFGFTVWCKKVFVHPMLYGKW